jgi:hypothetical protein
MLEVFAQELRDTIDLGIGPEVGIEPGKLVGSHAAESGSNDAVIRIQHGKLGEQLFGLPASFFKNQDRKATLDSAGNDREKFQNGLVRYPAALLRDAASKNGLRDPLLVRKA